MERSSVMHMAIDDIYCAVPVDFQVTDGNNKDEWMLQSECECVVLRLAVIVSAYC